LNKLIYILILLFLFAATSCKKKTTVSVQAQDYITGSGISYAGKEYAVVETWTPAFETKSKIIETGFLDANGHASFDLKMRNSRRYILGVSQPENICYGGLIQHYLEHEKINAVNFEYLTCGYVNIPYNNTNCEGVNDQMQYKYTYSSDSDIYIYRGFTHGDGTWDNNLFIEGCANFNGDFYAEVPIGSYTVEWRVVRPSGTTTGIDYFTVTENDTTTYLIEY